MEEYKRIFKKYQLDCIFILATFLVSFVSTKLMYLAIIMFGIAKCWQYGKGRISHRPAHYVYFIMPFVILSIIINGLIDRESKANCRLVTANVIEKYTIQGPSYGSRYGRGRGESRPIREWKIKISLPTENSGDTIIDLSYMTPSTYDKVNEGGKVIVAEPLEMKGFYSIVETSPAEDLAKKFTNFVYAKNADDLGATENDSSVEYLFKKQNENSFIISIQNHPFLYFFGLVMLVFVCVILFDRPGIYILNLSISMVAIIIWCANFKFVFLPAYMWIMALVFVLRSFFTFRVRLEAKAHGCYITTASTQKRRMGKVDITEIYFKDAFGKNRNERYRKLYDNMVIACYSLTNDYQLVVLDPNPTSELINKFRNGIFVSRGQTLDLHRIEDDENLRKEYLSEKEKE